MIRVLIGSTVRQDPHILEYFLHSLRNLNTEGLHMDYMFIDDNDNPTSRKLLTSFRPLGAKVFVHHATPSPTPYIKDEVQHYWNEHLVWRVAENKNMILRFSREEQYDYTFLVDSDLVLHPETLLCLVSAGKDIISEIFWTEFKPDTTAFPQVWLQDHYTTYRLSRGEKITDEERTCRTEEFLEMLKNPGVYRVGGLGACTLFSLQALESGISFSEIYNLSFLGEDRHLCIRAAALGFELFVDTHFPAYHIYRESDLAGVPEYTASFDSVTRSANLAMIHRLVSDVVKNLESIDFRISTDKERFRHCFTTTGWRMFARPKANPPKAAIRAGICDIPQVEFSNDFRRCELTANIRREGSVAGKRFTEALEVHAKLTRTDRWRVDYYERSHPEGLPKQIAVHSFRYGRYRRVVRDARPKLTLTMLVRNEADRYLKEVLAHAGRYVDEAVILDDASTDNSVELAREILRDIPVIIRSNHTPGFANEINLRSQLWELAVQTSPDWILCLDADEMFEERAVAKLRELIYSPDVDVFAFPLFDLWDMDHYREDANWNAHLRYFPLLVRYQPHFPYRFLKKPLHCGRFPANIMELPAKSVNLRVKHFGWARPEDRERKYRRYMKADPEGKYGSLRQYESILDPNPNLRKWCE